MLDSAEPPTDDPVESDLIRRIQSRDTQALGEFIERHRMQLCGFIRSITGTRLLSVVEVDDLLQEVSTAAITGLESAPLDDYEPMQWLQQVARRRVVDAHRFHFDAKRRDAGRQQTIHADGDAADKAVGIEHMLVASMTSASAAMSRDVRMDRMQQAIAALPDEQRTAIRLRYVDGLPTKDIAKQLGKTDVAIRVLLSRSMRSLEKQLEDVKPSR